MFLKGKIEQLDETNAMIRLNDGQALRTAISTIHGTPKMGSDLKIIISTGSADQPETQDLARALLNELIGK